MTPSDLKARREHLSLSQSDLAEAFGVHVRTVAAWEQERQKIPPYLERALRDLEGETKRNEKAINLR